MGQADSLRQWRVPDDDEDLLERLLDLALIDDEDADELEDLAEEDGEGRPPCAYAVDRGWVTKDQLRRLYQSLEHLIPTCYLCLKRTKVPREGFDGTFLCSKCDELVSFMDQSAGLAEALLPHPPSRVVDNILQQLLVKKKRVKPRHLEQLKQERKAKVPRPSLYEIVGEKELLSQTRLDRMHRKSVELYEMLLPAKKLAEDFELACFLLRLAIVGQAALSSVLVVQLDAALTGNYKPLRTLLREAGELTELQLEDWLPDFFDDREERRRLMAPLAPFLPGEEDAEDDDGLPEPDAERRPSGWSMSEAMGDMIDDFDDSMDTINLTRDEIQRRAQAERDDVDDDASDGWVDVVH